MNTKDLVTTAQGPPGYPMQQTPGQPAMYPNQMVQPQHTSDGTVYNAYASPPNAPPPMMYQQPPQFERSSTQPLQPHQFERSPTQPLAQPQSQPQAVGAQRQYQTAMPLMALNEGAAPVDCPVCGQRAMTRAEYISGSTTHMWALVLCLFVLLPCIPYLMNSTKDVKHTCGNCGVHLATWKRGGNTQVFQHA